VPPWQVHFATTPAQQAQGQFVTLSIGVAATQASLIVALNGQTLIWHAEKKSDPQVRSGLSGTCQWVVFSVERQPTETGRTGQRDDAQH